MSTKYDSKKIRSLAARVGNAAEAVSDVNRDCLKGVMREMPSNFRGSAATALQDSVGELMTDVSSVSESLYEIRAALLALAAKVEETDRRAASIVSGK